MQKNDGKSCGHEGTPDATCPTCGHTSNGAARPEPTVPAEVATWHIEHATPDILAWAAQTFNMEEFLAGKREIEQGRGYRFEDFINEIERITNGDE
jgi:hypothetical protein